MTPPGSQFPSGYDGSRYPSKNAACAKIQGHSRPVGRGRMCADIHRRKFLQAVPHFKSTIAATYHADQVSPEPTMVVSNGLGRQPGGGSIKSRQQFQSAAQPSQRAGKAGAVELLPAVPAINSNRSECVTSTICDCHAKSERRRAAVAMGMDASNLVKVRAPLSSLEAL